MPHLYRSRTPAAVIKNHLNCLGVRKKLILLNNLYIYVCYLLCIASSIFLNREWAVIGVTLVVFSSSGFLLGYLFFNFLYKPDRIRMGWLFGITAFVYCSLIMSAICLWSESIGVRLQMENGEIVKPLLIVHYQYFLPGIFVLITLDFLSRYFNSIVFKQLFSHVK